MNNKRRTFSVLASFLALAAVLMAAGCGGGSNNGISKCLPEVSTGTLTGNAYLILRGAGAAKLAAAEAATDSVYIPVNGVEIVCGEKSATSDSTGYFRIENVPVTIRQCSAVKTGYSTVSFNVDIKPSAETNVTLSGDVYLIAGDSPSARIISVASNVSPVTVFLDDIELHNVGNSLNNFSVLSGTHGVKLAATGYETSDTTMVDVTNGNATATINLHKLVTAIAVSPSPATIENVTGTQQYTATCTYYDGTSGDCTSEVEWTSSNTGAATIDAAGLATSTGAGAVVITATRTKSNVSGTASLTCNGNTHFATSVSVSPGGASISTGGSQQYTATCNYYDGTSGNCTNDVAWSSSNTGAATVSAAGLASAAGAGSTSITATINGHSGSQSLTVSSYQQICYNNHRYNVITEKKNWSDARDYCHNDGGYLMTVNDSDENSYLYSNLAQVGVYYWIGFNDNASEGTFVWENGEGVTYTNWYTDEPNDGDGNVSGGEDSTVFGYYSSGRWNDWSGTLHTEKFICEYDTGCN